ncbi:MAG TPA: class I SAM-dependent methyltransferase [Parafilimonas sp.]|nr:class I SAM-dependent methyltransferase [Parafilimonas sp.]
MEISTNIKQAYSEQYDDSIIEWRTMGAKYKAKNILELSKNINFNSVLEVGSGEGSILYWLSKWNFCKDLNGLEISESGVEITKSKNIENVKTISVFDGYKIPFKDKYFDLVICSHVMEHVEHERVLLREIHRVSKYQIFEVPIDFSPYVDKKLKHFMSYGHINIYTPSLFRFLLRSENFNIIKDMLYLYSNEILKYIYRNNKIGFYKVKIRHFVLKCIPYLFGIKPSSYVVLTELAKNEINIFDDK